MPFFVYILRNASNQLYIGQTNNPQRRLLEHTTKSDKAAKFTKDHDEFKLVYKEEYSTLTEAMRREKQLKGWSRAKKEALIIGNKNHLKKLSKSEKTKKKMSQMLVLDVKSENLLK